jgi:hypothetical protein
MINVIIREGISDEKYQDLLKTVLRPENCSSLTRTKVNQLVWNWLSPYTINTKTSSVTTQTEIIIYSTDRQNSSITKSNAPDSMSTIRRNYESEGISRNATNIILAS